MFDRVLGPGKEGHSTLQVLVWSCTFFDLLSSPLLPKMDGRWMDGRMDRQVPYGSPRVWWSGSGNHDAGVDRRSPDDPSGYG